MTSKKRRFKREWVRRAVQLVSLAIFVVLSVAAPLIGLGWSASQLFSRLDPLVGASVIIASRMWASYAVLGIITLVLALALGRAWCGWVCPLGTIIDIVPARSRKKTAGLPSWLRYGKYVSFGVVIVAAIFGTTSPMVLDPITILLRPLQEYVMPQLGTDAMGQAVGSYISSEAIGALAVLSILPLVIVVGLNIVAKRFWCSSLCPARRYARRGLSSRHRAPRRGRRDVHVVWKVRSLMSHARHRSRRGFRLEQLGVHNLPALHRHLSHSRDLVPSLDAHASYGTV